MNNTGHILDNNIDASHMVNKDHDIIHDDDLDDDFKKDLGLEYESTSQATSTPKESNSPPKLRSNLDEVIELVIQDAIEYADAPEDKRILPALTRKSTKVKVKAISINSSSSINTFTNVASPQQQLAPMNTSGLLMSTNSSNNPGSFHPLVQANLTPGMQHMLQLATSAKPGISMGGSNTPTSLQHQNNTTQQQQQMASAMMGFSAAQLPNMIMPSYNTNLQSNYSQQTPGSQYQLPVSLSQIQLAQQQQSSHLLLGNNPNSFTDLSSTSGSQQNINFGNGISNANQQLLQSSYGNFGTNSGISVSPYQIPNMIQAYTQPPTVSDNTNPISQNDSINSAVNLNSNPTSASCFHSSKTNNNNALTNSIVSNNQNISTTSSAAAAAAAAASLYQNNPFELQQTQLYAHHRLLQAQQQQQSNNTAGLFPDYAAVMARYGTYH